MKIGAATSLASAATERLATALCEEFSDAPGTTYTDFEPGDDEPRDREPEAEGPCDLGYRWGESCTESTETRHSSTSESYTNEDGDLEIVVTDTTETVTRTDCEWTCIPA